MFHFEETKLLKCNHFLTRNTTQIYTLEYNDNVHIYSEKTAASYDNRRTAILSVFIFADGGAGVGIHTTVHFGRQPAPDSHGSRTDSQLSIICWHLNLALNLL